MTDAPKFDRYDDRYHPHRIQYAGETPRGWCDEYRFVGYVRLDLYEAQAAEIARLREALKWIDAFTTDPASGATARAALMSPPPPPR